MALPGAMAGAMLGGWLLTGREESGLPQAAFVLWHKFDDIFKAWQAYGSRIPAVSHRGCISASNFAFQPSDVGPAIVRLCHSRLP